MQSNDGTIFKPVMGNGENCTAKNETIKKQVMCKDDTILQPVIGNYGTISSSGS